MKKFGWAYLGCGGIAHTTAKELKLTKDNEIVAAWNRTPARAEKFVHKFGGKAYATPEEAITAPGVEGVYIAVTADKHAELMKLCIRHHKSVLCEKPFTVNAQEAKEILALAETEGVYVSEAMWTWHNGVAQQVKEWVQSGKLGTIQKVHCAYAYSMLGPSPKPRLVQPEMIGGALMDIGVYAVRYCYELFGMPKEVICKGRTKWGVDLSEDITLRYEGFDAELTVAMDQNLGERLVIFGSKGTITVPLFHMARKAVLKNKYTYRVSDTEMLYGTQFSNVAAEIREGRQTGEKVTAQGTVDCMAIMDQCRRQMGVAYPGEAAYEPAE